MIRRITLWMALLALFFPALSWGQSRIKAPEYRPPLIKTMTPEWYVRLDDRWYPLATPAAGMEAYFVTIYLDPIMVMAHTMQASNCLRVDYEPMPWTPYAFYYGPYLYPIWDIEFPIRYHLNTPGVLWIEVNTNPGDMICDGEVDAPDVLPPGTGPGPGDPTDPQPPTDPDVLFRDGFEEWRLFCDSFEASPNVRCNPSQKF